MRTSPPCWPCPCSWRASEGRHEYGYVVRTSSRGLAVVPEYVLSDPVAVADLAYRSTPGRLRGWIVRNDNEIEKGSQ